MNIRNRFSLLIVLLVSSCQLAMAQKDDDDSRELMRTIGWIAKDPALRAELEISEAQSSALQDAAKAVREEWGKMWRERGDEMKELGRLKREGQNEEVERRWKAIQAEIRENSKEHYAVIDDTLLPHQVTRMKQITLQQKLKRNNPYKDELGAPLALAGKLDLTPEEIKALREAIEKARKEFYKEMQTLKQKATDDIMAALPPEKAEQLKEMMGDTYDPQRAQDELRGKWQSFSRSRAKSSKKTDQAETDKAE